MQFSHFSCMAKGKVLCVDDDAGVLEILKYIMEKEGYEPITARDGSEAFELFRQHESSLVGILLDLYMPNVDGIAVMRKIRESSKIPAIAVSAYLNEATIAECEKAGFTGYINKPFDIEQLIKASRELFGNYAKKKTPYVGAGEK